MSGNYDFAFESEVGFGEEPNENNDDSVLAGTNIVDNEEDEGTRTTIDTNVGGTSNIYGTSSSGYRYNNRYYYKSLNNYGKAIYDALESNIDNLKTGTYRANIDYDFNSLLSSQNGQAELRGFYNDAVNALNLDVPNLFYIDFEKMFLTISETKTIFSTKYNLYIDQEQNANYLTNDFGSKADIDFAIAQIDRVKNQAKARRKYTELIILS